MSYDDALAVSYDVLYQYMMMYELCCMMMCVNTYISIYGVLDMLDALCGDMVSMMIA